MEEPTQNINLGAFFNMVTRTYRVNWTMVYNFIPCQSIGVKHLILHVDWHAKLFEATKQNRDDVMASCEGDNHARILTPMRRHATTARLVMTMARFFINSLCLGLLLNTTTNIGCPMLPPRIIDRHSHWHWMSSLVA